MIGDLEGAVHAYEQALRHNPYSVPAMNQISAIFRTRENFPKAVEYLQAILKLEPNNGEVMGSLGTCFAISRETRRKSVVDKSCAGHCYLMMEDLQQAYNAYQNALYHLPDPKVRDPPLRSLRPTQAYLSR